MKKIKFIVIICILLLSVPILLYSTVYVAYIVEAVLVEHDMLYKNSTKSILKEGETWEEENFKFILKKGEKNKVNNNEEQIFDSLDMNVSDYEIYEFVVDLQYDKNYAELNNNFDIYTCGYSSDGHGVFKCPLPDKLIQLPNSLENIYYVLVPRNTEYMNVTIYLSNINGEIYKKIYKVYL